MHCVGFDEFFIKGEYQNIPDTPAEKPLSSNFEKLVCGLFRRDLYQGQSRVVDIDYLAQEIFGNPNFEEDDHLCAVKVLNHVLKTLAIELTPRRLLEQAFHRYALQRSCLEVYH